MRHIWKSGSISKRIENQIHNDTQFRRPQVKFSNLRRCVIKASRLSCAGHLSRMDTRKLPAVLLRNDPQGRPTMRWIDGDLKARRVQNWWTKVRVIQT